MQTDTVTIMYIRILQNLQKFIPQTFRTIHSYYLVNSKIHFKPVCSINTIIIVANSAKCVFVTSNVLVHINNVLLHLLTLSVLPSFTIITQFTICSNQHICIKSHVCTSHISLQLLTTVAE